MPATPEPHDKQGTSVALIPLLIGIGIMLAVTVRPQLLSDAQGRADHLAATLICWGMAAGFVRGVGFIPQHRLLRWLLSGYACVAAVLLTALRLFH